MCINHCWGIVVRVQFLYQTQILRKNLFTETTYFFLLLEFEFSFFEDELSSHKLWFYQCVYFVASISLAVPWKYNINHDIPSRDGFPNQLSNVSLWIIISTRISPFVIIPVYLLLKVVSLQISPWREVGFGNLLKVFCGANLYVWKKSEKRKTLNVKVGRCLFELWCIDQPGLAFVITDGPHLP